ncbi:MAG: peptide chain release factor N(5)-glutamine methyltransferase [Rikenellaceae bacterium]
MTIREAIGRIAAAATPIYGEHEAKQIGRIAIMELGHYTPTQIVLERESECRVENIDKVVEEISTGRPLQYIIGETEFCSLRFKVQEGVLIPRPETEELVMWIAQEWGGGKAPQILDVGTGSGAIAVSLASMVEGSQVWAVDISEDALSQARANSVLNDTNVRFVQGDALAGIERLFEAKGERFDIVVSNPPYIPRSESREMRDNVVGFEPHMALFVDEEDPLIFYRRIAQGAQKLLRQGGKLYFEIHENFAPQMVEMLREMGYEDVVCRNDINEKPRMICAQ